MTNFGYEHCGEFSDQPRADASGVKKGAGRKLPNWNVEKLVDDTEKLYARIVEKGWPDKLSLTTQKIIEARGWESCQYLFKDNIKTVLEELGWFYVPKVMQPGPAFVFPIRDVDRSYRYAQTKPLAGSALGGASKYRFIGIPPIGPAWLGNQPAMLKRILQTNQVILVEGAFDLLACRVLEPNIPVLSPLTKRVGKKHLAYLRMLGVKRLYFMFDNELPSAGRDLGAGNLAMEAQSRDLSTYFQTQILLCPSSDASEALKSGYTAERLRSMLRNTIRYGATSRTSENT
jgi:hypothetical protein